MTPSEALKVSSLGKGRDSFTTCFGGFCFRPWLEMAGPRALGLLLGGGGAKIIPDSQVSKMVPNSGVSKKIPDFDVTKIIPDFDVD